MTDPTPQRLTRICDGCKQIDSDPHHVDADSTGATTSMHMDCCRDLRDCPICREVLVRAKDVRGDELLQAVENGAGDGVVEDVQSNSDTTQEV